MGNTMPKWVWGRQDARPRRFLAGAAVLLIAVCGMTTIYAQGPLVPGASLVAAGTETDSSAVRLLVGRSTVVDVGTAIARVSLTSADVADAMVTSPSQLLVNGKMPGTISMFVWDRAGSLRRYEVSVQRDLARLAEQVKQLFPGEKIEVQSNGKNIVLSGSVSNKDIVEKAVNVAAGYVGSRDEVVSLLQLTAGAPSNQVLLRVRFAEVSRTALTELGASFFTSATGVENNIGRITTQQFPSVGFDELKSTKSGPGWENFGHPVDSASGKLTFSDFLNFFLFNEKYDLGTMVRALQTRGLFQSLAEPNLVAESGKEASFLAGGEIPVPVVQGTGGNVAISVTWKEFGIRLNFTPTVTGDRVHLRVRPEVSTLDFANAVVLQGFRIPALSTRRTETELELNNRQTFAIAGLMNNSVRSTLQKVPGIGNIPILGLLFTSKAAQKDKTELVVMITPEILPNNSPGVTSNLPRGPERYMPELPSNKSHDQPPPAFSGERRGAEKATKPIPVASAPEPTRAPASPAAAAAAVSALTPGGPKTASDAKAPTTQSAQSPAVDTGAAPAQARPLTEQEKRMLERARRDEQERARDQAKLDEKTRAEEAAQILAARHKAEEERARQEKLDREKQKRDAEAAKKAEESARKKAEKDREEQKSLDEAAERLKAAEALYNAELAKRAKQ